MIPHSRSRCILKTPYRVAFMEQDNDKHKKPKIGQQRGQTMADYSESRRRSTKKDYHPPPPPPPPNSSSSSISTSRDLSFTAAATSSVAGGLAASTTSAISSCGILICPLPPSPPISPFRRISVVPQLDSIIPLFQEMNPFDDDSQGRGGSTTTPSSSSSPSRAAAAAALALSTVPTASSKNSITSSATTTTTPPRGGVGGDTAGGRTSNPFDDGSTTREEEDSANATIAHATTSASSTLMNPFAEEEDEEENGVNDDVDSTDGLANQEVVLEEENINRFRRIRIRMNQPNPARAVRVADESNNSMMMTPRHSPMAPTAEASWQYLGDLPYRRIPVYDNVQWYNSTFNEQQQQQQDKNSTTSTTGLACFPTSLFQKEYQFMDRREMRQLLQTSTITKVAGCPHGGPIAVVTLPVATSTSAENNTNSFSTTEIRILSNSGKCLSKIDFPNAAANEAPYKLLFGQSGDSGSGASTSPTNNNTIRGYKPADILTIGFTSRAILIVLLRDSLCLTYTLRGEAFLPPFYVLPSSIIRGNASTLTSHQQVSGGIASANAAAAGAAASSLSFKTDKRAELIRAHVYEGGVACLSENKHVSIAEILYGVEDADYISTADLTARIIRQSSISSSNSPGGSGTGNSKEEPFALVTLLPTADYAATHFVSFRTLAVLPRHCTSSRHPEVFVSTQDRSVIVVQVANASMGLSSETIVDVACQKRITSPIVDMRFAPNGRFLACFTQDSMLTVISTSFETKVLDFDTSEGSSAPPLDMQWCGEDSVVLHWKNMGVLMVGPYGDWLRFVYEGSQQVHLLPEMDSCRVITDSSVELLQRVPPNTALLLRIGSIETSAMLLDAADAFTAGSPASDEAARSILQTGQLHLAIEACVEAALKEFDIVLQKRLLRAASYGMHYSYKVVEENVILGGPLEGAVDSSNKENANILPSTTTAKFVAAARKLKILNALRNPQVGFVLTSAQYDAITPLGVVARLIAQKRPSLATAICKYLALPRSVQLFARAAKAAALVERPETSAGRSDAELAEAAIAIINQDDENENKDFRTTGPLLSVSTATTTMNRGAYATVAMAANKAGRPGVANLLLLLESSVADKIPALIATGSYADAVAVATAANDGDFIFSTLWEYERYCMSSAATASDVSKAQAAFHGTVVAKFTPEAFHTLRQYLECTADVKTVANLLLRAQKFSQAGTTLALRAMSEQDTREKQGMLSEASRVFGLGKETAFEKSCTDDFLQLIKDQEVIRTKYGAYEVAPESSSVTSTIASMLQFGATNVREQHRLLSDADKLAKKYRITERRLWHIKVKAFQDSEQWSNLRILADSRKTPPIGFKPFARAAIRGKQNVTEILRYLDRIAVPEERYDLYCEASLWKKALEEAIRMRDGRRVLNVKTLCNSQELLLECDQAMGRLA